jgi:hypothetical protein
MTLFCSQLSAQGGVHKLLKKLSTKKDSMVVRGVDRRYIDIPDQPWQVMLRGNISQTIVSMKANGNVQNEDYDNDTRLVTRPTKKIGFKVGYRGCGFGYSVNVGDLQLWAVLPECLRAIQQYPLSSRLHQRLSERLFRQQFHWHTVV